MWVAREKGIEKMGGGGLVSVYKQFLLLLLTSSSDMTKRGMSSDARNGIDDDEDKSCALIFKQP